PVPDPGDALDGARLRRRLDPLPHRRAVRAVRRFSRPARVRPQPRHGRAGGARHDPAGYRRADRAAGPAGRPAERPMIEIRGLHVTFGRGTPLETPALRGVDLIVPTGQFVTVIGSNGAGKSTLLNAITGDVRIDRGRVLVGGVDVTGWPAPRRAGRIARVFQDPMAGTCEGLSIEENMALAAARGSRRGLAPALSSAR